MESESQLVFSLKKENPTKEPKYIIGIDTYDKNNSAYCLMKKNEDHIEVLLAKTIRDENEFKEEVENIAKYFNAVKVFSDGEWK